uniref:Uncharacterized protein n=1 Tax=Octopus bimaculoides TaxID=37653 RepID=A0A0L8IAJ0_OCTBM
MRDICLRLLPFLIHPFMGVLKCLYQLHLAWGNYTQYNIKIIFCTLILISIISKYICGYCMFFCSLP